MARLPSPRSGAIGRTAQTLEAESAQYHFFTPTVFWPNVLIGMAFVSLNFPRIIETQIAPLIGYGWLRDAVVGLSRSLIVAFQGVVPSDSATFQSMMSLSFLAFAIYLTLVVVLSISRLRFGPALGALAGIVLGVLSVHLIAWLLIGLVWVVSFSASLFLAIALFATWLLNVVGSVIAAVVSTVTSLIYAMLAPLVDWLRGFVNWLMSFDYRVVVLVATAVAALFVLWLARAFILHVLVLLGASALLIWAYPWLAPVLSRVWSGIAWAAGYAIAAGVFVLAFAILLAVLAVGFASAGNLVTDQLRSAFRVRRIGVRSHTLSGFALGSALALVLFTGVSASRVSDGIRGGLVTAAGTIDHLAGGRAAQEMVRGIDPAGAFGSIMPSPVREFADRHMRGASAPYFDAALLVVILALSILNVALSIFGIGRQERTEDKALTFLPVEVIAIVAVVTFSIAAAVLQSVFEGD